MKINADFSKRVVMNGAGLPWVASPMPGVDRRMLERDELFVATDQGRKRGEVFRI